MTERCYGEFISKESNVYVDVQSDWSGSLTGGHSLCHYYTTIETWFVHCKNREIGLHTAKHTMPTADIVQVTCKDCRNTTVYKEKLKNDEQAAMEVKIANQFRV